MVQKGPQEFLLSPSCAHTTATKHPAITAYPVLQVKSKTLGSGDGVEGGKSEFVPSAVPHVLHKALSSNSMIRETESSWYQTHATLARETHATASQKGLPCLCHGGLPRAPRGLRAASRFMGCLGSRACQ